MKGIVGGGGGGGGGAVPSIASAVMTAAAAAASDDGCTTSRRLGGIGGGRQTRQYSGSYIWTRTCDETCVLAGAVIVLSLGSDGSGRPPLFRSLYSG